MSELKKTVVDKKPIKEKATKENKEIKSKNISTTTKDNMKNQISKSNSDKTDLMQSTGTGKKIAVIRVRGSIGVSTVLVDTLKMLNLSKKNSCIIFIENPSAMGMLRKAKDYITWGEISDETLNMLLEKRKAKGKCFHLNPPRKGYGRKGVKVPFVNGGALGYRKDKINDLIQRML
jgi:large subunit ribosomal protein L30